MLVQVTVLQNVQKLKLYTVNTCREHISKRVFHVVYGFTGQTDNHM